MHISDGILPQEVWISGCVAAAAVTVVACRALDERRIPELAVFTSLFFVISSIHVPMPLPLAGTTSVHPLLVGLLGVFLGRRSWIAIVVGLFFQVLLLGHGGFTTLGVNAVTLGLGAWTAAAAFSAVARRPAARRWLPAAAGAATITGTLASAAAYLGVMAWGGKDFLVAAELILVPTLAASILEAVLTAAAVSFVLRAKPEMLIRRRAAILAGIILGCCAAGRPALAHGVELGARRAGEDIEVGAAFAGGTPLAGADVTVRATAPPGGDIVVLRGKTDRDGVFRFPAGGEPAAAWNIVVEDEAGHRQELALSARDGPWSWPLEDRSGWQRLGRVALGTIAILALFLGVRGLRRRRRHAP
jgi:cobalt/nickel transport system permease protein